MFCLHVRFSAPIVSCSVTQQRCRVTVGVNVSVSLSSCSDFIGFHVRLGWPGLGSLPQWGGEYGTHTDVHKHTMMLHWKMGVCTAFIYRVAQRLNLPPAALECVSRECSFLERLLLNREPAGGEYKHYFCSAAKETVEAEQWSLHFLSDSVFFFGKTELSGQWVEGDGGINTQYTLELKNNDFTQLRVCN